MTVQLGVNRNQLLRIALYGKQRESYFTAVWLSCDGYSRVEGGNVGANRCLFN